ncbi:MAG: hypothetical protein ACLGI6_21620 [Gammaproteobacteria bacterium]
MTSLHETTLWRIIDRISTLPHYDQQTVGGLFNVELDELADGGNDVFRFFKSQRDIQLKDVKVTLIDLRVNRDNIHPGFLVLRVGDGCVPVADVRQRYPDIRITDVPRGRSLDEVTSYSVHQPWGKLSFSFKVRSPDCLAGVSFDPVRR